MIFKKISAEIGTPTGPQEVQIWAKKSPIFLTLKSALRGSKRVNRCLLATFFFIFLVDSTVADESRVTTPRFPRVCPVSVLLVGKVLNCLNREKKSYFFLSDRRFLNPLNHKKKSYFGFLGEKILLQDFFEKKLLYSKKQKKSF